MYYVRKIRGFNRYSISTDGEIFDCKKEKYLKQSNTKDGYLFVNLISDEGERKTKLVHRLVAETFILNYSNKETVNHKDENKQNNNVLNLSWCTNYENTNYGTRNERSRKILLEKAKGKAVICIDTNSIYDTISKASRETGIDRGSIRKACNGKFETAGKLHWEFI